MCAKISQDALNRNRVMLKRRSTGNFLIGSKNESLGMRKKLESLRNVFKYLRETFQANGINWRVKMQSTVRPP